ncbi:MAG: endolytic transglycosylase MltG, partial [Oscillospiraceae bacterium]
MVIVACSGLLAIFMLQSAGDAFGLGKPDQQVELTVKGGMSTNQIASLLKEQGVIEQPLTFRLYSMLRGKAAMQAGDYVFNSNMSYDQILQALRTGNTIKEEVKVTFYEGMTIVEMAQLLEEKKVCGRDALIDYLQTAAFGYEFEEMIPQSALRFRRLEGYLFPDTYDFYVGENVDSVAKKFLRNFQNRVFPKLYEEILNEGYTLDQAVTLASVIQKEAGNEEEMARVSAVFHNRMNNPAAGLPKLQSDVTIFYVEEDIKPFLTHANQKMYDAYNTYICDGMPVGPICSPGIAAIRAAIQPEKTEDYFFVTDVNGKYYYSKTLN